MTIQDSVFGRLEYNGGWTQNVYVPMFAATLSLLINNSPEFPPAEEEHQVWQQFMRDQSGLKAIVERVIFDYYNRHLENLRMPYGKEEEEEFAPTLKEPQQVWDLLKPQSLWLEMGHDDASCSLSVDFWTKWDEEHGLDVVFYQDQIGVADSGAHWLNHDRYDLQGKLLYLDGEE